ncbi:hypothetical protein [Cedecea davisae]|uniref:hypothetical protein n=1 Tax=Cedecea davisae TaxID=158484 RepID=UPI001D0AA4CE|nr:hypothetical protein [Cedecea davisae]
MKLNILTEIKVERIIKMPLKDILSVETNAMLLGYISIERDDEGDEVSVTPFTSNGLMDDVHCMGCAINVLAQNVFHAQGTKFDVVESSNHPVGLFAAMLTSFSFNRK